MKKHIVFLLSVSLSTLLLVNLQTAPMAGHEPSADMVKIGNFYMDKYEFPNRIGEYPVTNVTWSEATAMCESVGKRLCTPEE